LNNSLEKLSSTLKIATHGPYSEDIRNLSKPYAKGKRIQAEQKKNASLTDTCRKRSDPQYNRGSGQMRGELDLKHKKQACH
jgi:hypothetical protein